MSQSERQSKDLSGHALECLDLVKRFGSFTAVDGISLTVPTGSFFSILGPSGCGKTTLLRMIAGFQNSDSGDILIHGNSVINTPPNRRPVNMIFQHLALFPMMTVGENVAYGLRRRKLPNHEIITKVASALERVDLPGTQDKRIDQLSGGQKQRIAIARCLVLEPELLLLDEPLGALDLKLREHMKIELKQLQKKIGTTFVYITHDQSEALLMSDQIAVMNEGRFEQVGTPQELYYQPATAFVSAFVGESNHWRGKVDQINGQEAKISTEGGIELIAAIAGNIPVAVGDDVSVYVRPESVSITTDQGRLGGEKNKLAGCIENLFFNGANSSALVRDTRSGGEIMVSLPQTTDYADLSVGAEVHLGWNASQAKCFADNTNGNAR